MTRLRRFCDHALIGAFLVVIVLPLMFLEKDGASLAENRPLAPLPAWRWDAEAIIAFPKAFEKWFDDHFGFRHRLVQAYHLTALAMGTSGSPRVLSGKEGWLFYTDPNDGNSLEDYRRSDPLSPEELDRWRVVLEAKYYWLKRLGIPYVFVVAPDKHTIYPEYFPRRVRVLGNRSRLDQLMEVMKDSRAPIVDLREPLRRAKGLGLLYHRTDSHWNDLGAVVAHEALMEPLSAAAPDLAPRRYRPEDFLWRSAQGGDLARMLNLAEFLKEPSVPVPRPGLLACTDPRQLDPMNSEDPELVVTTCRTQGKTLLVFRDSFFSRLRPYFSESFGRVVYTSAPPETDVLEHFVRTYKPDVVVEERVERYLKIAPKRPDPSSEPFRALHEALSPPERNPSSPPAR